MLVWLNTRMVPITCDKYKCTTLFKFNLNCPYLNENGVIVEIDINKMDSESTCSSPNLTLRRKMAHHKAFHTNYLKLGSIIVVCNTYSSVVLKSTSITVD